MSDLYTQKVFVTKLESNTKENKAYRRVLNTNDEQQLVLMYLKAGTEIGTEVHTSCQFIRLESGKAQAIISNLAPNRSAASHADSSTRVYKLNSGDSITIPPGTTHNIIATTDVRLYTIYSPPVHRDGLIQMQKPLQDDPSDVPSKGPSKLGKDCSSCTTAPHPKTKELNSNTQESLNNSTANSKWVVRMTYDNFSWGVIHKGFWITAYGTIYKYSTDIKYPTWSEKVNASVKVGQLPRSEWDAWIRHMKSINTDSDWVKTGTALDAGGTIISVMLGPENVVLASEGTVSGYLNNIHAKKLRDLIVKLNESGNLLK